MLDQAVLKSLLYYHPESGIFTWLVKRGKSRAGARAGHQHKLTGYRVIGVNGKIYPEHRLAWLYMTGNWPINKIDHIDREQTNNIWSNLRAATTQQNAGNCKIRSDNTSGYRGVSWYRNNGKWRAGIKIDGKDKHLGFFNSPEEAFEAYKAKAMEVFGEYFS
jgi:hypothetical protein